MEAIATRGNVKKLTAFRLNADLVARLKVLAKKKITAVSTIMSRMFLCL